MNNSATPSTSFLSLVALFVALIGSLGSFWLSVWLGYKACPLCFYQRSFLFASFGLLAVGLLSGAGRVVSISTLALPTAVGGTAIAGLHVYLETVARKMDCPEGLFGLGTVPQQSLTVFAVLTLLLLIDAVLDITRGRTGASLPALVVALALGGAFEEGARAAFDADKPNPVTAEDRDKPKPTTCRPIRLTT